MTALLLSITTFFSTLAGGLLALRLRRSLHFVLAFIAGVLIGVVALPFVLGVFMIAGGIAAIVASFSLRSSPDTTRVT